MWFSLKLCSCRRYYQNFATVGWAKRKPNWKAPCQSSTLLLAFWLSFIASSNWFQRLVRSNGLFLLPNPPGLPSQFLLKYSRKPLISAKVLDAEPIWPKPEITSSEGIRAKNTEYFIEVLIFNSWQYTSFSPRPCILRELACVKWKKQRAETIWTKFFSEKNSVVVYKHNTNFLPSMETFGKNFSKTNKQAISESTVLRESCRHGLISFSSVRAMRYSSFCFPFFESMHTSGIVGPCSTAWTTHNL